VSLNEVGICVGLLLAYSVNVLFIDLSNGWRYMFGLSAIPAFIQGVGMFFLPQSPRWLIVNGQDDKACRMIKKLQWSGDPYEELTRIKSGLRVEYRYKFTDLLSSIDNMRSRMFVGGGVVFFQQFSGQPTVVYYASTIFQALGFQSGENATLASLGIGIAKLVATVISLSFVDRGGRRRFLLIGVSIMAVSILVLGTIAHYISLGHPTRECHFNMTTPLQSSNSPSSPSLPHILTTTAPTRSIMNSTYISRTLPTVNSTVSLNQTESTAITANKGLRYFTLCALALFVGAYSFSFGPGKSVGGGLRTFSGWYPHITPPR